MRRVSAWPNGRGEWDTMRLFFSWGPSLLFNTRACALKTSVVCLVDMPGHPVLPPLFHGVRVGRHSTGYIYMNIYSTFLRVCHYSSKLEYGVIRDSAQCTPRFDRAVDMIPMFLVVMVLLEAFPAVAVTV